MASMMMVVVAYDESMLDCLVIHTHGGLMDGMPDFVSNNLNGTQPISVEESEAIQISAVSVPFNFGERTPSRDVCRVRET